MLGITPFGMFHTLVSLAAVAAAVAAFARVGEITPRSRVGRLYIGATVVSCVTGFFIFHHGGFGKPHVLGIVTLVVLAGSWLAGTGRVFGRAAPYVERLGYTTTVFFHMIPGFTETLTRLPEGAPWATNADDSKLQPVIGAVFLVYLLGAAWHLWALHRKRAGARLAAAPVA